jgi:type I restriction enzyme S subunit
MARKFPLGTIPARGFDWDRVLYPPRRVGDFADLSYGKSLVEGKRKPGSVPVYGTNGPCGWTNEGLKPGPGVILGRKGQGPLGVEWCDGPFWVIDTAYFASVTHDVDLKWFYYIVKYVGLNHLKSGEKPGLQRDTFRAQLFPFPEKDIQAEIALVLSALDAKIACQRYAGRLFVCAIQLLVFGFRSRRGEARRQSAGWRARGGNQSLSEPFRGV